MSEGGKRGSSAWISHIKKVARTQGLTYREAMKVAKKTYKKHRGGGGMMGAMPPMGGKRMTGGTLYGFTGGPYTGSELSDGAGRFPVLADATWKGPSELLSGGRRKRTTRKLTRRRRHRGGATAGDITHPVPLTAHAGSGLPFSGEPTTMPAKTANAAEVSS